MSSAVSVAAVSAPSRSGAAIAMAQTASVNFAQAVKPGDAARKSASVQTAPDTASLNPHLPLGLLLSVSPPPSGNAFASSDYAAMQTALRTDNLAAAQQAYMRLQSDLQMDLAGASALGAKAAAKGNALDAVA